ncbi:SDR family NAD(P)-dependent oxidoreductase [Clostridium botulinum]|uniref:SDR family NAD(P)-dependent oxidoreductase n=1 Tax=Clostridium botulinum TaxID=1491 RepID=UPI000773FCAA|nr:SDR family oxidoreductase [Clostridium botulinum]MBY6929660.1 SDR family oxidoreductase [Clostridium botulinum]NFG20691.1 SDR family oxidoreductase [Clostridium botulinum]NFO82639.1 SDR family oxidoreductase [Clostridium botulinum]
MNKELINQVAIVTGGNTGIGRAVSEELAERGAKVMILARNEEKNEETKKVIVAKGGYAESYRVDVSNKESVDDAIKSIYEKHGKIDILVCNAGNSTPLNYLTKMPMEDIEAIINTHVYGAIYCVKACGEKMKERKYGRIVIMSSLGAYHGVTGNAHYCLAKEGLVAMAQSLAKEFGRYGITVNSIQPGSINTSMSSQLLQVAKDKIVSETPVARIGEPEDIAYATAFYCSPRASFITGDTMRVDGGYIIESGMDRLILSMIDPELN